MTARYAVPVPAETLEWCDDRSLEEVFREAEGHPTISCERALVLPFYAKMTDQTGHTQHVAFIAPVEPSEHNISRGLRHAYIVTTD